MEMHIRFNDGTVVHKNIIKKARVDVLIAVMRALPEEYCRADIIKHILSDAICEVDRMHVDFAEPADE